MVNISNLYKNHLYLNKDIEYLISREIIEYDIQSAGFNIIKHFKLLNPDEIDRLESIDKHQRHIAIGLYQNQYPNLVNQLNDGFTEMRKVFFEANQLSDDDVLSIKKDAIITLKHCTQTTFDNIIFAEKNIYTSYFYLSKFEFYLGNNILDVKGISEDKLELHKEYMLDFLQKIFKMIEVSSRKQTITNLVEFSNYYKERKLAIGYYRELNADSLYKLGTTFIGDMIGIQEIDTANSLDISYNYLKYIVPLINILI